MNWPGRLIAEKYGLVGIVNYAVGVFLLAAYVAVQLVRHGSVFSQWPTMHELALTLIGALCLFVAHVLILAAECWLEFRRKAPPEDR